MPTYVLLTTLTDEGRKTVKERPARIKEVNQELGGMGARVISQYAVLGAFDFVSIVDAPNNETIARISARVPIMLTSRADSVMARLASCAVAVLLAEARRANSRKAVS